MAFFLAWSVEAKFFFIFACLIGVVLPSAGLIRVKNQRSTSAHILLDDADRAERGAVVTSAPVKKGISFGIQAMEEESDVDGLWNSKTSTPLHTPLPSPTISSRDSNSIRQALAKLSHSRRTSSSSATTRPETSEQAQPKQDTTRAESLKATSAKPKSWDNAQRVGIGSLFPMAGGDTGNVKAPAAVQLTPLAGKSHICSLTTDETRTPVEHGNQLSNIGPSVPCRAKKFRTLIISNSSESSNAGMTPMTSDLKHLETLNHMEAHRRFHAAESGQLQPRTRRSCRTSASSTHSQLIQSHHEEQHGSRAVSWPVKNKDVALSISVAQHQPVRRSTPYVIPFRAFVEQHPPPKPCPSAWTERTQDLMEEKVRRPKHISSYTITNSKLSRSSSSDTFLSTPQTPLSSDNVSIYSQTARKVNEGFEVLPAGTLDKQGPVKDFNSANHQVLIQQSNGHRQARKLQKRARSRSSSLTSTQSTDCERGCDISGR